MTEATKTISNGRWLTAEEVRNHFQISESTLWRIVKSGEFPKPFYLGSRRRWREADIVAFENKAKEER
jgi:predicted DNA-binding transcriptional regulator AlpA